MLKKYKGIINFMVVFVIFVLVITVITSVTNSDSKRVIATSSNEDENFLTCMKKPMYI